MPLFEHLEDLGLFSLFPSVPPKHDFCTHSFILLYTLSGVKQTEATMMFKYNRQSRTLSSDIQIPDFDVDFGTILRLNDESEKDKKAYKLTLDIQNKKITEVTLMGHIR